MPEFSEDQRIVVKALVADEFARQVKESAELKDKVAQLVGQKLPRLSWVEKVLSSWYGLLAVIISFPLAAAGGYTALQRVLDAGVGSHVRQELNRDEGPLKTTLNRFSLFSGKLADQFANSVDSATTKLLRFGCNSPRSPAIDRFPPCVPQQSSASLQAANVLEVNDQTIIFKANQNQRVLLRLQLSRIDAPELLQHVGLRIHMPSLLSTTEGPDSAVKIESKDLPDTHKFVDEKSGLLKLYGSVSDAGDQEPLRVDIEITRFLRKKSDLHALRFRAEPTSEGALRASGSERFFIHALVVVTHNLPKE